MVRMGDVCAAVIRNVVVLHAVAAVLGAAVAATTADPTVHVPRGTADGSVTVESEVVWVENLSTPELAALHHGTATTDTAADEAAEPRYFTLVLVKPDGVERGLVGDIISRFERRRLKFAATNIVTPSRDVVETHYDEHRKTKFFPSLVDYMTSGPLFALIIESPNPNVVEMVRLMIGSSDVLKAEPGSIRGDYAIDNQKNTVHASADADAAAREIALWFPNFDIPKNPDVAENSILTRLYNRVWTS